MKGIAFQLIASSVALALMAGVAGFHWWQLGSSGDGARGSGAQVALVLPGDDAGGMVPVSTGGEELDSVVREHAASPDNVQSVTVQALQEVVSVLRDMKEENENLRKQLEEVNGEMNGLQIRIDGYSDSFRPLKLDPTEEGVYDSGNPLLPPKRW